MIPPHVTAIAWVQAMGPSSPVLNTLGLAPPPGSPHPLYGRDGVIALLAVRNMSHVFLVALAALRALPREMPDATRIAGAGASTLLRRVVLPLLKPRLLLPVTALFGKALMVAYGLPLYADTITFDRFRQILFEQSVMLRAFRNSTLTAGAAAFLIAGLCIFLVRMLAGPKGVQRRIGFGISTVAETTYTIPGLVISVAFILAFIRPLPTLVISIYNTMAIILLAYLSRFFATVLKPIAAAFLQFDPGLDEAPRVFGAGFGRRTYRITLPLVAQQRPRVPSLCS
ncbi:hypothetical protein AADZ90_007015 [Aestuariibius sp. 2305UL40-4]|uniref:hypothetical protein n=1 Tax=Aestuariibius violaceus TaxID=3234132 RepID=UPI00345EF759